MKWTAPAPPPGAAGAPRPWELVFVRHVFRSSPTRYIKGRRDEGQGQPLSADRLPESSGDTGVSGDHSCDLSFATLIERAGHITPRVLPPCRSLIDVTFGGECVSCTYTHRSWSDGELYFFFNEGNQRQSHTFGVSGHGSHTDGRSRMLFARARMISNLRFEPR